MEGRADGGMEGQMKGRKDRRKEGRMEGTKEQRKEGRKEGSDQKELTGQEKLHTKGPKTAANSPIGSQFDQELNQLMVWVQRKVEM